jgi:hypothetical protein
MAIGSRLWNGIATALGLVCLVLALLLLSPGVRAVHAEDGGEAIGRDASVSDESPATCQASPRPTVAARVAAAAKRAPAVVHPASSSPEVESDVINLNTRGYNYAPPPAEPDPSPMHVDPATN